MFTYFYTITIVLSATLVETMKKNPYIYSARDGKKLESNREKPQKIAPSINVSNFTQKKYNTLKKTCSLHFI